VKYGVKNLVSLIGSLSVCFVLISINKIGVDNKKTLVNCVKDLYRMGFTSPVPGNHSVRVQNKKWKTSIAAVNKHILILSSTLISLHRPKPFITDILTSDIANSNGNARFECQQDHRHHQSQSMINNKIPDVNTINMRSHT
jgi:hypothetical protein